MRTSYIGRARSMLTSLIGKRGRLVGHVKLVVELDSCCFYKAKAEVDGYKVFFTVIVDKQVTWRDEVRMYAGHSEASLITQWVPWNRGRRMTNKANLTKHMLKALL